jgi:uncharacterized RDD family membrane protein YckC
MRCPKCHYVSFDGQNRCRNCGYDLSLSQLAVADTIELPTNTESTATPLADLSLKIDAPGASGTDTPTLVDRYMPPQPGSPAQAGAATRTGVARAPARQAASVDSDPLDLPLFNPGAPAGAPPRNAPSTRSAAASGVASVNAETAPMRVPPPASPPAPAPRAPADDRPLVSGATPPRAPLAVRRPTGDVPRARRVTPAQPTPTRIEEPRLDLGGPDLTSEPDLDDMDLSPSAQPRDIAASIAGSRAAASRTPLSRDASTRQATVRDTLPREVPVPALPPRDAAEARAAAARAGATASADAASEEASSEAIDEHLAPLGTRVAAGAIDLVFMLAVDAVVLYFTLRITGLPLEAWRRLPIAPLVGFLALLHVGYLTMFTAASGQTMGKMLTRIRVVASHGGPVPFGSAVVRAVAWLITIVPAGVGFIPAILATDRRALHDRFADTKVIKTTD